MRFFVVLMLAIRAAESSGALKLDADGCHTNDHYNVIVCPDSIYLPSPGGDGCYDATLVPRQLEKFKVDFVAQSLLAWIESIGGVPCVLKHSTLRDVLSIESQTERFEAIRVALFTMFCGTAMRPKFASLSYQNQQTVASTEEEELAKARALAGPYCQSVYSFVKSYEYLKKLLKLN